MPAVAEKTGLFGRRQLTELVRRAIAEVRASLLKGEQNGPPEEAVIEALGRLLDEADNQRLSRVINATGVIVHTNLGRAPLGEAARNALIAASGYCTLEYDLSSGTRGRRARLSEKLICELTHAEAAIIVNNCAAAAFFVLKAFANGGEAIVSRGELVEIGGDFRVPDILAESGVRMVEVGTTNRTRIADFERAIQYKASEPRRVEETANLAKPKIILSVHPSNYRIIGFAARPTVRELAELAHRNGLLLYHDAGSGSLLPGVEGEPTVAEAISAGADLVSFSGDKLLGGPQAGIVVGRAELIDALRRHPLYRALRVDKLKLAALEATLAEYAAGRAAETVTVQKMLAASQSELRSRAEHFIEKAKAGVDKSIHLEIVEGASAVGGGSAPDVVLASTLIAVEHRGKSASAVAENLRKNRPPVIARIADGRVLLDLRTVSADEEPELLKALLSLSRIAD
jgi:L-seryl-tRNA(Ser) seleniumtransferase